MVKRALGFTLIETLVGIALSALLCLLIFQLNSDIFSKLIGVRQRGDRTQDLSIIQAFLNREMTGGDTRYFAFTGWDDSSVEQLTSRFLIPVPGRCADLSTNALCAQDTAFVFISVSKATLPAAYVVCRSQTAGPSNRQDRFLIRVNDRSYGTVTDVATGFQITPFGWLSTSIPALTLDTTANTLLALSDGTRSTLFRTIAKLPAQNYTKAGASVVPALLDACTTFLFPAGDGTEPTFGVEARSYVLEEFTSGPNVLDPDIRLNQIGTFPVRLSQPRIYSMGKVLNGNERNFGVLRCSLENSAELTCPTASPLLEVKNIQGVRFDHFYKNPVGAYTTGTRFEIIQLGAMQQSSSCSSSTNCHVLTIPNPTTIKTRVTPAETLDTLDSSGFSLLKQEALAKISIRINIDAADFQTGREVMADVVF